MWIRPLEFVNGARQRDGFRPVVFCRKRMVRVCRYRQNHQSGSGEKGETSLHSGTSIAMLESQSESQQYWYRAERKPLSNVGILFQAFGWPASAVGPPNGKRNRTQEAQSGQKGPHAPHFLCFLYSVPVSLGKAPRRLQGLRSVWVGGLCLKSP